MLLISFKSQKIERLCKETDYAKKFLPPVVVKDLQMLMYKLMAIDNLDFFRLVENQKYHIEKLYGKLHSQISLRLKDGYRMYIKCTNTEPKDEYINMTDIIIIDVNHHVY